MDRRYSAIFRDITGGGAKTGRKVRGPGAWGCPKLVPYACIPGVWGMSNCRLQSEDAGAVESGERNEMLWEKQGEDGRDESFIGVPIGGRRGVEVVNEPCWKLEKRVSSRRFWWSPAALISQLSHASSNSPVNDKERFAICRSESYKKTQLSSNYNKFLTSSTHACRWGNRLVHQETTAALWPSPRKSNK